MKILAIETSCDETALAVLSVTGSKNPTFKLEASCIASQIELHAQYGGVFPMMAKREHSKNIIPLFLQTLKKAKLFELKKRPELEASRQKLEAILEREPELLEIFLKEIPKLKKPKIDTITVTVGPGLAPALWVGINFAKALSFVWDIPLVPVNHMEGHILSIFPEKNKKEFKTSNLVFPSLSLLVSGGHTELVLVKGIGKYKILGQTRDDAAGEAFDKIARMLELPYPGGPHISRLAKEAREKNLSLDVALPRPMIHSKDFDFSFSGLKTSVLYLIQKIGALDEKTKMKIARDTEDAIVEVLVKKTLSAVQKHKVKNIIVGGGVSANSHLKKILELEGKKLKIAVSFPTKELSTDNAIMIGIAGYFGKSAPLSSKKFVAQGNMSL
jgi:N6-L-threonylcarbamoyladenine synthase